VTVDGVLHDHHARLRRLLAAVRSARAHALEPAFEALADAVEIDWVLASRHLHPLLERLGYPELHRAVEVQRALCHVVDDLRNVCEPGPQLSSALAALAARLEQHVVDTERMMLPFVAAHVAAAERERVGLAMLDTVAELESEEWLAVALR